MDKPMDFIHLTYDKLRELGSLCPVSNNSDKTFTDLDFNATETIPCLEQPALAHVVLCVEDVNSYEVNIYHNACIKKDIWNDYILMSMTFTKIDINDTPEEYANDKVIGQHWLSITSSCWFSDKKVVKSPTIYVRPSISTPGYIDILLPPKGAESLYNQLKSHDGTENNVYTAIFDAFVRYIVVNQVLLSNGGKYHKTGSKASKSSVLSMAKRTLPGKVSLKNIDIDVDAFIADHPPRKHDETSNDAVKIWHCPAWEVRGHYRHYKNGKVSYVKQHVKGKLRDTLVVGREYDLDTKCKE